MRKWIAASLAIGTTLFAASPALGQCTDNGHNWMGVIATKFANKWAVTPLNKVMLPGSHDAGTFGEPSARNDQTGVKAGMKKLIAKLTPSWAVTQSHSIYGQLCKGARWFDVRLKYIEGTDSWRIFHNFYLFATGDETLNDIFQFVNDANHRREVVFIRLKLDGPEPKKVALLTKWIRAFGRDNVVSMIPGKRLGEMTMTDLGAIPGAGRTRSRVVILVHDKPGKDENGDAVPNPVPVMPPPLASKVFSYIGHQSGEFSGKVPLDVVVEGQTKNIKDWKNKRGDGGRAFGLWWTSTGAVGHLNVRSNTKTFWPKNVGRPNTALEQFIRARTCRSGNFLVVDFYGDNSVTRTPGNIIRELAERTTSAAVEGRQMGLCAAPKESIQAN